MKIILLFLTMLFFVFTKAQITITSIDMPSVNDTVRYSTSAVDVSAMLNDTGANRVWDFTNLIPNFQDIISFKNVINTNPLYYATFNSSNYGTQDPNINFTVATATNVYTFFTKSTTNYVADGRAFTVSGLPLSQTYAGKDVVYKFPLAYGNSDTNSYTTNTVSLAVANLSSSGKRINIVDGWGSITTPFGTFNCIRIKSTVQQTDTISVTQIPFPISVPRNKTEYKWFANGKKIPILEVDVTTGINATTTVKYRDSARANAFNGLANFSANKTTFAVNSTDTCILTSSSLNTPKSYLWTITPNTFTFTGGTSATSVTPKIFFTSIGTYTVKLHVVYNAGSSDTTRVNYITAAQGPTANFGSSITGNIAPVVIVNLYDSSTGNPLPTEWKWTFVPGKISFVGGTSSTSQNPKITFDSATNYAVTLRVTNSVGSNSITKYFGVFYAGINNNIKQIHQAVNIYPNPAKNYFEINVNKNEVDHFELYDAAGKLSTITAKWSNQSTVTIDCHQLIRGIYFVKVFYSDQQIVVKKVSVQ